MSITGQNIIVMPVSGLKSNRRAGGDSLLILAPSGALSKKPPLQTKLSGGSMSLDKDLMIHYNKVTILSEKILAFKAVSN